MLFSFLLLVLVSCTLGKNWNLRDFIADTVVIALPLDSIEAGHLFPVEDRRELGDRYLTVRQKRKFLHYVPVDEYLLLEKPLSESLGRYLAGSAAEGGVILIVDNLTLWHNTTLAFRKGWLLNGYTRLVDENGAILRDWQWEVWERPRKRSFKLFGRKKKEKLEDRIGDLVFEWFKVQKDALAQAEVVPPFPHRYRRQFTGWIDVIAFPDGYALDARLALDFPADRMSTFVRGVSGMYYRRGRFHESIAVRGMTQHWYRRIRSKYLLHINLTQRLGFNGYTAGAFDYLDWWNLFFVNVSVTASVEYRPVYHKGLFWGVGLHPSLTLLPEVVNRIDVGLAFTMGIVLP